MGWGIAGAVAGGVALLVSLVTFAMLVFRGPGLDAGPYDTLRGTLIGQTDGGSLGGDRLAITLEHLEDDYGYPDADFSCPDTARVTVSTVIVCHGQLDGYDWTGAVLFEDTDGSFAVVEL